MMDTREVAAYLRLKERRIYDLVRSNALPHMRATGKLLFPQRADRRVAGEQVRPAAGDCGRSAADRRRQPRSAARMGGCAIRAAASPCSPAAAARASSALRTATRRSPRCTGSTPRRGEYNVPLVRERMAAADVVVIEWARRTQGLLLAAGNPLRIKSLADLVKEARACRAAPAGSRQPSAVRAPAGSRRHSTRAKLAWLRAAVQRGNGPCRGNPRRTCRCRRGDRGGSARARTGLHSARRRAPRPRAATPRLFRAAGAVAAGVRAHDAFAAQAAMLGGYDVAGTGRVVFNS